MARTKEELQGLITVLKELNIAVGGNLETNIEKANAAIGKIGSGKTSGYEDIIQAFKSIKTEIKGLENVNPEGIHRVNTALAETLRLTGELERAKKAASNLTAAEGRQLNALQNPATPAAVSQRLANEARISEERNRWFNPESTSDGLAPAKLVRGARTEMESNLANRPEALAAVEATKASKTKAESDIKVSAQLNELSTAIQQDKAASIRSAETKDKATLNATQQGLLQAEITKRQGEIAAQKASDAKLRSEGEMYYNNPQTAGVGINRPESIYGQAGQAASATEKGNDLARKAEISAKETVADLEQQKLLQQEINKILERRADEKQQPLLESEIAKRQAQLNPVKPVDTPLDPQAAALKAFGDNQSKLDSFNEKIGKMGFGLENMTRISKDAATGITTMSGSIKNAQGVTEELTVHVDRFGNVVQSSSNNFKSFGDVLANNVKKMLEWVIAGGLIFGALSKLKEVFGNMKELQNLLNDITITTGQTGEALRSTFDSVVGIADIVGVSAIESLKAMNYALKITGDSASSVERTARATQLLTASLTLAKLGAIPVTEAMDTLVAALEQSGKGFDYANKLLDSFQAVSKISGGSIDDLATTFGIAAGSAIDVGLEVDQLNGVIGAFAAATTKSAEETGNALKVMFSNYQTDSAEKSLSKYGIAVRDFTTGAAKPFMDVMNEIYAKKEAGLISPAGMSEITNAIGGGPRRAPDVTALVNVMGKVPAIEEISKLAKGDAVAALAIKQKTLETATEQLNNAFLKLSNTLGDSGGFVELMTTGVKFATAFAEAINDITKMLGPMTSALAGLAALGIGNKLFGNQAREMLGGLSRSLGAQTPESLGSKVSAAGGIVPEMVQSGKGASDGFVSGVKGFFSNGFGAAITPVIGLSLMEAMQGNYAQAGASAIAGGIMAGLTKSSGWASIAAILASVIVSEVQSLIDMVNKGSEASTAGIQTYEEYKKKNPNATADEWQQTMRQRTQDIVGDSTRFGTKQDQILSGLDNLQRYDLAVKQKEYLQKNGYGEDLDKMVSQGKSGDLLGYNESLGKLTKVINEAGLGVGSQPESQNYLTRYLVPQMIITAKNFGDISTVAKGLEAGFSDLNKVVEQSTDTQNNKLSSQVAFNSAFEGEGTFKQNQLKTNLMMQYGQPGSNVNTSAKFNQIIGQGETAKTTVPQILSALHPDVKDIENAKEYSDKYNELFNIMSRAPEDRSSEIVNLANAYNDINIAIKEGKVAEKDLSAEREKLGIYKQQLEINLQLAAVESAKSQVVYPGFTDYKDLTKQQVLAGAKSAERLQDYTVKEMGIDPDLFKQSLDDIYVMTKDGLIKVKGLSKDFFSPAIDGIKDMKKSLEDAFNFQNLRQYPQEMAGRIQKAMNYYQNLLKQYGLNEKIEKMTFLFKDNQVSQLVGSQTALQLALQDLTEVEKKQLDGVYNLPSGATAYIPLQSGQALANNTANNVGAAPFDYGDLKTPALTPLVNPLDQIVMNTGQIAANTNTFSSSNDPRANTGKGPLAPEKKPLWEGYGEKKIGPFEGTDKGTEAPWKPTSEADLIRESIINGTPYKNDKPFGGAFEPLTKPINDLMKLFGLNKGTAGTDASMGGGKALASPAKIDITVKPEKVTNDLNAHLVIQLDGRVVANVIKKYIFEDYQRLTASVGKDSRSRPGVL